MFPLKGTAQAYVVKLIMNLLHTYPARWPLESPCVSPAGLRVRRRTRRLLKTKVDRTVGKYRPIPFLPLHPHVGEAFFDGLRGRGRRRRWAATRTRHARLEGGAAGLGGGELCGAFWAYGVVRMHSLSPFPI